VLGRTPFDVAAYLARFGGANGVPGGIDPTPFATGGMLPPDPTERGFKDTVKVNPGQFTTIRARFDLPSSVSAPQSYVHHCHIVEHEDNDMMRDETTALCHCHERWRAVRYRWPVGELEAPGIGRVDQDFRDHHCRRQ
jgi:hypothetical protein